MKKSILLAALFLVPAACWAQQKPKTDAVASQTETKTFRVVLKGVVHDRPQSSELILMPYDGDPRVNVQAIIPIRDGKFEYAFDCPWEELYVLVFKDEEAKGTFRPLGFFAEPGTVEFTLYPYADYEKNKIQGGALNRQYQAFRQYTTDWRKPYAIRMEAQRDSLEKAGNFYTPEAAELEKLGRQAQQDGDMEKAREYSTRYMKLQETGDILSAEGKQWEKQQQGMAAKYDEMIFGYITEHPDLVGYGVLLTQASKARDWRKMGENTDFSQIGELYRTVFAPRYPFHPYTQQMETVLSAATLGVGTLCPEVTMETLAGKPVKLSEKIAGKVALVHLWASWCGPCRRHGIEMIPVYDAYKSKGFVVVGIARENKTTAAMQNAMKLDGYPWEDFVELNDKNKIWSSFGLGNSGGGDFLIGRDGKILAVNPSAEEVTKILREQFK